MSVFSDFMTGTLQPLLDTGVAGVKAYTTVESQLNQSADNAKIAAANKKTAAVEASANQDNSKRVMYILAAIVGLVILLVIVRTLRK